MRVNAIFMIYSIQWYVLWYHVISLNLVEFITLRQFHSDSCGVTLTDIQLSLSSRGLFLCQVIKNHRRVLSSGGEALPPRSAMLRNSGNSSLNNCHLFQVFFVLGSFLLIFDVFFVINDVWCFCIVVFEYLDLASQRTMPPVVRLDAGASLLVKSRLARPFQQQTRQLNNAKSSKNLWVSSLFMWISGVEYMLYLVLSCII